MTTHGGREGVPPRHADEPGEVSDRRTTPESAIQVRADDMHPYVGLRYVASLFRIMAVVLALLLFAEIITGLRLHGAEALVFLLAEVGRLLVLAGLLWASADIALLLIDVGHDVRATRILIGRQAAQQLDEYPSDTGSQRGA